MYGHKNYVCLAATLIGLSFSAITMASLTPVSTPIKPLVTARNLSVEQQERLRDQIGQKIMLDFRYFCPHKNSCKQAQISLTDELKKVIRQTRAGGIILFSENVHSASQLLTLTHKIQTYAKEIGLPALFIGIDQEGGRVNRLPRETFETFAGNMAIGATYANHGVYYSSAVGRALSQQLSMLGINLNFAPSIDVNSNPNNPIINVRSFSDNPLIVSALGLSMLESMQNGGVMAALKHFPGHGDTTLDSHLGLPRVEHSLEQIQKVDLYPFQQLIKHAKPAMIMTAHIQYPQLDSTLFTTSSGHKTELPATLSDKILTGILRDQLAYTGVIISDAMDMRAISAELGPKEAIYKAFAAGIDIALMPVNIKSMEDLIVLNEIMSGLVSKADDSAGFASNILKSSQRINSLKRQYKIEQFAATPLEQHFKSLQAYGQLTSGINAHSSLAASLSQASVTLVRPSQSEFNDYKLKESQNLLVIMPDKLRCAAFLNAMAQKHSKVVVRCKSMLSDDLTDVRVAINERFILADISPDLALHETLGFENRLDLAKIDAISQRTSLQTLLDTQAEKAAIFVAMRSPHAISEMHQHFAVAIATYDYQVEPKTLSSPAINSLIDLLYAEQQATGILPVELATE